MFGHAAPAPAYENKKLRQGQGDQEDKNSGHDRDWNQDPLSPETLHGGRSLSNDG
jgi:hypothetical protein